MATTTTASASTSNLESLTTAAFQSVISFFSMLQSQFNRIIPPERQAAIQTRLSNFASRRPFIASLLLSQLAFSGVPILLFGLLALGVLLFSLVTALVVGVLAALLFTATCVGFGLLVLLPVLMITTFLGVAACGWGWVGWLLLKWFGLFDGDGGGDGRGDGGLGAKQDGGKYKIEGENGFK